ncbi:hypothetical protein [Erwinia pyrifoliae]|uniref:hypothetical protein n=1 Tax=Erwinia pyrifoliae TaxID=79967 RepID=UPI00220CA025|nr:hypothetical protein [Erwinia pyrifoliae]UWS30643.1 hypothetical protein NYP81_04020 [Erwinia pyrifoliae]
MSISSNGNENRLAGRDFNENKIEIERFDGSHTINVAIPSEKYDDRPLVKAQRKELNCLVTAIAEAGETEAFVIWQKLHAEIGVTSIEGMTINQYQAALSYLQAMLDRCKEKDASRALVSLLLRNSEGSELRQKLIRYCNINFGTGRLNDLNRSQLQLALSWLDQHTHGNSPTKVLLPASQFRIVELLRNYPKEIGCVFIVGVVVGMFIF